MKIAIAGFQHETNRFCPIPTTYEDFVRADSWPPLTAGTELFEMFRDSNIPLGGCIKHAQNRCEIIPILWASAEPAGLVTDDAFDRISSRIINEIEQELPLDGIYLDLHGAMVTESYEDGEGEFLKRLRNCFGTEIPVAVSLDLHANITSQMVDYADVITIYRTYPHIDMANAGFRASELLHEIIKSKRKPYTQYRKIPFLPPLQTQCTYMEPCRSLYAELPSTNSLHLGVADIALGFPPSDIAQNGPAVVVYDYCENSAKLRADKLNQQFLDAESYFNFPVYESDAAIALALEQYRGNKPVIVADIQDSAGAGASSDTTGIITALVKAGVKNTILAAFCDQEAAEKAHELGVNRKFDFILGGKLAGPDFPGYSGTFKVSALSNGIFKYKGEMMAGCSADLGPIAALDLIDNEAEIRIVVTSLRHQALDRAIFTHLGIDPQEKTLVVLKSTLHFRADFESMAETVILAETPGLNYCVLNKAPFTRLPPNVRLL